MYEWLCTLCIDVFGAVNTHILCGCCYALYSFTHSFHSFTFLFFFFSPSFLCVQVHVPPPRGNAAASVWFRYTDHAMELGQNEGPELVGLTLLRPTGYAWSHYYHHYYHHPHYYYYFYCCCFWVTVEMIIIIISGNQKWSDLFLLHETHCKIEQEHLIRSQWGFESVVAGHHTRMVAVLFKKLLS